MTHEVFIEAEQAGWIERAGSLARDEMRRVVERTGRCRVALSGGSTPAAVFEWFALHLGPELERELWITWADERVLPRVGDEPGWRGWDERVSARLAYARWLGGSSVRPERVLALSEGGALKDELPDVRARFDVDFDGGVDVALLGAGADGHVASLFPGRDWGSGPGVIVVRDSPKPPPVRVSLTMETLTSAVRFVWARGEAKAEAFGRAESPEDRTPLGVVTHAPGRCVWVLDEPAAGT